MTDIWAYLSLIKVGASLVTQTINNLPAMQEIWIWSPGGEDTLD